MSQAYQRRLFLILRSSRLGGLFVADYLKQILSINGLPLYVYRLNCPASMSIIKLVLPGSDR
jgi:hypothetical protein